MNTQEYNGWTNYETWLTKLWMDNDQGTYNRVLEVVADHQGEDLYKLEDALKEFTETEMLPDLQGFAHDLAHAALSEVNWQEIALNLRDESEPANVAA